MKESSLGDNVNGGSHVGIGQYDADIWNGLGETGSINNIDDQIAARFNDLKTFEQRYLVAYNNNDYGLRDAGLILGEYYNIKHNDGQNGTNWFEVDPLFHYGYTFNQEYENAASALG